MKKNKIINLFNDDKAYESSDSKYSSLLQDFIEPFAKRLDVFEYQEDIFEFAIKAWNFGNLSLIIDANEFDKIMSFAKSEDLNYDLLFEMIQHKQSHFKDFSNFVVDFEISNINGRKALTLVTQTEEIYLSEINEIENNYKETDFTENYINRSAISLKPLQPFIDWHNSVYPDSKIDDSDLDEVNIYLIKNSNFFDIENYLKKKFDLYFKMELEDWCNDRKTWPKRRNYKMFKQWFRVDISTAIYDLENTPVIKQE
ncbi:hypothetical protein [Polaribacter sp. M15]